MTIASLFSPDGRLNRKPYWLTVLGIYVASFVVGAIVGATDMAAVFVLLLPLMWVSVMVIIRRFHDLGKSGWHYLTLLIPFYNIWVGIQVGFFAGTAGDNAYGPDPLKPEEAPDAGGSVDPAPVAEPDTAEPDTASAE